MSSNRSRLALIFAAATVVLLVVALWFWAKGRNGIDPDDAEQVALGRRLYQSQCAECHGADLKGEPDWQVRLPSGELPAPPHDASGHSWHHPDEMLFAMTKYGMSRFAPPDYKSKMPSFVGILTDAEIRAVIAYIKSTWPEEVRRRQDALSE